jgi:hypothetical protein
MKWEGVGESSFSNLFTLTKENYESVFYPSGTPDDICTGVRYVTVRPDLFMWLS